MDLQQKRNDILPIAAQYGARNLRVFGSVARGDDRAHSDVDLLVDMDPDRSLLDNRGAWSRSRRAARPQGRRVDRRESAPSAARPHPGGVATTVKDERLYLGHIRDAIIDIEGYTSAGRDAFMAERMRQDAVIRKLEIIGEAVKQLSATTRERRPEIPWKQITLNDSADQCEIHTEVIVRQTIAHSGDRCPGRALASLCSIK